MPIIKYECSICRVTYPTSEQAEKCEALGIAPGYQIGQIFKFWDSNTSYRILAAISNKPVGHKHNTDFISRCGMGVTVSSSRCWGLEWHDIHEDEFWSVVKSLCLRHIKPDVVMELNSSGLKTKTIPLLDLFDEQKINALVAEMKAN